jgi:dihydroneopterin aldolase
MSKMLASVNGLDEALFIQDYPVDIIDLKQPSQGALGALAVEDVKHIVARLAGDTLISATIGDLPMQPDVVFSATQAMASTGVDYVKIGFFPGGDWQGCIDRLAGLIGQGIALIAVLFADNQPDFLIIQDLKKAGFKGVMLDTMDKSLGSLTQLMSLAELTEFVRQAQAAELLTGLAGSLSQADIAELKPLRADYLGFRGALCQHHCRTARLDAASITEIGRLLRFN